MYLEFGLDVDRGLEKGDGDAAAILNARSSIARSGTNCYFNRSQGHAVLVSVTVEPRER